MTLERSQGQVLFQKTMHQDRESVARKRGPREFGPLWSPIFVPLMFIAAGLSIPYALGWVAYWKWKEKRFAEEMRKLGRAISFDEVVSKLKSGEGTVIHEWYTVLNGPVRHWWTPDDVLAISPHPIVNRPAMARRRYKPLAEWFFHQYTSSQEGKALFFIMNKKQSKSYHAFKDHPRILQVQTFSRESW